MHIIDYFKHPEQVIFGLQDHGFGCFVPDKLYIKCMFLKSFGYPLDLHNPQTFNEKLQWLKLYDRKPCYSEMVDKISAKNYIGKIIGEQYIVPSLGQWNTFHEIDFNQLPDKFVLKCNHDSGGIVICKSKEEFDYKNAESIIQSSLKRNYYYPGREWPYKQIQPKVFAEKLLVDKCYGEVRDYKFFCFNGRVRCYKVDFDRFINHKANYYDVDAKLLQIGEAVCPPDHSQIIDAPKNLKLMIELAEKLSVSIPFVRVDFYEVDNKVYFGEMTFFPASGFGKFYYEGNDSLLGNWIELPLNKRRK